MYKMQEFKFETSRKGKEVYKELRELQEEERKAYLNKMTKKELLEYYKLNDEDIEDIKRFKKPDMIKAVIQQFNNRIFWENY